MEALVTPQTEPSITPGFSEVPVLIREHGRSRGFERLRDIVLEHPLSMGSESLLPVLKMVIELDRHALFSEVSEAKARERMDRDAWEKFQEYLRGDDVTSGAAEEKPKNRSTKGKNRGERKARQAQPERAPLREEEGVLRVLRGPASAAPGHEGSAGGAVSVADGPGLRA